MEISPGKAAKMGLSAKVRWEKEQGTLEFKGPPSSFIEALDSPKEIPQASNHLLSSPFLREDEKL